MKEEYNETFIYSNNAYCEAGADKIDELQREVERSKVFEEYCENMKEFKL